MRYSNFWLSSLDEEQHKRTCGYWYTVTTHGSTPHTAFRTKAALFLWLGQHGIMPTAHIPDPGEHSSQQLEGSYSRVYVTDEREFRRLTGVETATLHNARYVPAIITVDNEGHRTVHVAHYDGATEFNREIYDPHFHGRWGTRKATA